jgi:uncharacterized membrane protein
MENKIAVYGIYPSIPMIENGVDELKREGFRNSDISVLYSSSDGTKKFAHENSTKMPEGATTGTLSGATIGGILGWLAGIGTLAIPGVGPFIAAGPIMATLAGAGVGGALGGLTGALIGFGIPEYEAKMYEAKIGDGGILISVHSDNKEWRDKALTILKKTGAEDISSKDMEDDEFEDKDHIEETDDKGRNRRVSNR